MTTTIPSPVRSRARARRDAGFTLSEVMIGATLSVFILAGVLTMMLFLGRSGANISNYADMESEARRGLERFAEDTRQASDIAWTSDTSCTLTVNAAPIVYFYDSRAQTFSRTAAGTTAVLVKNVRTFAFKAYMITGGEVNLAALSTTALRNGAAKVTKQVQISLRASRTSQTVATATNTVLSARFILRNKQITA